MFTNRRRNDYQPVARSSLDSPDPHSNSNGNFETFEVEDGILKAPAPKQSLLFSICCFCFTRSKPGRRGRLRGRLRRLFFIITIALAALIFLTPIFNPSYSVRPPHYTGTNPLSESVYIAANIIDEDLIRGPWGDAVVELIDRIGPENAFLSVYENDSGEGTRIALQELARRVKSKSAVVSGHIDLDTFPTIQVLPGDQRVKRIAYLAEVRNQALRPLDATRLANGTITYQNEAGSRAFDKLLFLNDVVFSPKDAMDLLFATNLSPDGKTQYHAACAMDFINAFKFYDTYAGRDSEAYRMGVPFFPWFSKSGNAHSWRDVMRSSDAVRVKSCWGGMVAFEAKWFQSHQLEDHLQPLRFRYEEELFWDASECCLIHADLEDLTQATNKHEADDGIYMNPYIRVAYDAGTFKWLEFTRKFERLYTLPHIFVDWIAGLPFPALRRLEIPGTVVERKEWKFQGPTDSPNEPVTDVSRISEFGHWETVNTVATPGGFCGYQQLFVLRKNRKPGEKMWEIINPP